MDIELKLIAFWIILILSIPLSVFGCISSRGIRSGFFVLMVFSLCFPETLSVTFVSHEGYRSATRGLELHLADICAFVLGISICLKSDYKINWILPTTYPFIVYLIISIISWILVPGDIPNTFQIVADYGVVKEPAFLTTLYPLFEISKIIRGYFIFWVSANFLRNFKEIQYMLYTIVLIIFYFTIDSLYSRYGLGIHRVTSLSNVNVFNTFVGMLGALVLPQGFKSNSLKDNVFYWSSSLGALLCIVLTVSRSSLVGYLISLVVGVFLCMRRFKYKINYFVVIFLALISLIFFIKSYDTLLSRFSGGAFSGAEVREGYNMQAILMADEHFFGVGLGNFTAYSIEVYGDIVGAEKGVMAHNIWYLTLGELGYIGLIAFIVLWIRYYQVLFFCIKNSLIYSSAFVYATILGVLCESIVLQGQNLYHFSYRQTSVFFMSQILMGLTVRIYMDYCKKETTL